MNTQLRFTVLQRGSYTPNEAALQAFLQEDKWDDWGKFRTQYHLIGFDEQGHKHSIGNVKIGEFGLKGAGARAQSVKGERGPDLPTAFTELNETFFSLGQDEDYYEALGKLPSSLRDSIVKALRDVVADNDLWKKSVDEDVMSESLLRFVKIKTVEEQFRRLLAGGAKLLAYNFKYTHPMRDPCVQPKLELSFSVQPNTFPPTNIHVIIGRNGVGKTYSLNLMAKALVGEPEISEDSGVFEFIHDPGLLHNPFPFANLVYVSFSAFDNFDALQERKGNSRGMQYSYIGLRRNVVAAAGDVGPKTPEMLAAEFVKGAQACMQGSRQPRWNSALSVLEADPIFKEAEVAASLAKADDPFGNFEEDVKLLFNKLSSGHKIVLLTIARLVETVDEKTLVLLDEPEGHLHPPLLSAFIRALSGLMINRNGVAIIATHSPVVLQEVPKDCVWKLRRSGLLAFAERPEMETFGENVGVLTRDVFGLEVTHSGFHKMISEAVIQFGNFNDVVEHFDNKLGAEARSLVRALLAIDSPPNK